MNKHKLYPELVTQTLNRYPGNEDVCFIELRTEFPYPMTYKLFYAYSLGVAAVDAMIDAGFKPLEIATNLDLKERVVEQAMDFIEAGDEIDLQEITARREALADQMNSLNLTEPSMN